MIAPGIAAACSRGCAGTDRARSARAWTPTCPHASSRLIVSGCDNIEIGSQLQLSSSTIKHHVSSILKKLGVENPHPGRGAAVQHSVVEVSAGGGS